MKFIANADLREWVKDSLRKAIFQKAHALAVQTGCEIFVKVHDTSEHSGQYYATHNLQRAYLNHALRKHPAEMFVSGETGSPSIDQGIQIGEDVTEGIQTVLPRDIAVYTQEQTQYEMANQIDNDYVQGDTDMTTEINLETMSDQDTTANLDNSSCAQRGETGMEMESFSDDHLLSESIGTTTSKMYPISQSPKLYQCALCQKAFRSIHILQMHSQTFHSRVSTGLSPTKYLNIRGKSRSSRKSNAKPYQEQNRYPCTVCERTFHHPDLLKDHVSRSHMGESMLASSIKSFRAANTNLDTSSSQSQLSGSAAAESLVNRQNMPETSSQDVHLDGDSQMIQMSPMKPLPHTELFMNSLGGSPSVVNSSLFSQSPMMTPLRYPVAAPSSRNSTPTGNQAAEQKGPLPIIKIMKAILAIGGPIATSNTVKDNLRNRNYDRVTNELFVEAANKLKDVGLGHVIACKNGSGRLVDVFIKRPPAEVLDVLEMNTELCDPNVYVSTFASQTPVRLMRSSQLMENLIASGLVAEEHLKTHPKSDSNDGHNSQNVGLYDGHSLPIVGLLDVHNLPNVGLSDGHNLGLSDGLNISDGHNVGLLDGNNVGLSDDQHVGPSDEQHVGSSDEQHVGPSDEQHVDPSDEQNVGLSEM